jgi:hypothetical protein
VLFRGPWRAAAKSAAENSLLIRTDLLFSAEVTTLCLAGGRDATLTPLLSMVMGFAGSIAGRTGATTISAIERPLAPAGGRVDPSRARCSFGLLLRMPRREWKQRERSTAHPYSRKTPWSSNRQGASWLHGVDDADGCAFKVCRAFPGCAPGRLSLAARYAQQKQQGLVTFLSRYDAQARNPSNEGIAQKNIEVNASTGRTIPRHQACSVSSLNVSLASLRAGFLQLGRSISPGPIQGIDAAFSESWTQEMGMQLLRFSQKQLRSGWDPQGKAASGVVSFRQSRR